MLTNKPKLILLIVFLLQIWGVAAEDTKRFWVYEESWQSLNGDQVEFIEYFLTENIDAQRGALTIEGYQAAENISVKFRKTNDTIDLVFEDYIEPGLIQKFSAGDVLLKLKLEKDKLVILEWVKLQPALKKNEAEAFTLKER